MSNMTIHIEGFLKYINGGWENGVEILDPDVGYSESLAKIIDDKITKAFDPVDFSPSECYEDGDEDKIIGIEANMHIPRIAMRAYYTSDECTLEEAKTSFLHLLDGALDIYQVSTGYSEWTIMGYSVENFSLVSEDGGTHDLTEIFKSHQGEYVHILIDVIEM